MIFASVCSGIEAASVAWHPLGWRAAWLSEIDAFACATLAHHYPTVPNLGDMTRIGAQEIHANGYPDVLVGGTPCQSFSVAGLRKGMDDPRGNLALVFLRLLDAARARWVVWENVPGVLSSAGGRDFGAFLGALGQLGYGWAYRVMDAQYFGVAQRRRRVFVVGRAGGFSSLAAAVLFERASLRGDPAPSREAGAGSSPDFAPCLRGRSNSSHRPDTEAYVAHDVACGSEFREDLGRPLVAPKTGSGGAYRSDIETETLVAHSLRADGFDASEDGTGRGTPLVAFDGYNRAGVLDSGVRRLTPRECERLQGFPDDYTLVPYRGKPASDGPRYRAIGNSMAVPVMAWIGRRIDLVDAIPFGDPAP